LNKLHRLLALVASLSLLASMAGATAAVTPESDGSIGAPRVDNLSSPLSDQLNANRQSALERKLQGKANAKGRALQAANGQYVDFPVNRTDRIFVIIAEFGDEIDPSYLGTPGPQHNQIAQPNRAVDNVTIWQADYNKAHYEDMYFNQMKAYYKAQSSGRYTFNGDVVDWVRVPYNEARYGSNLCGSNVCSTVWYLIRDAINTWTANQIAAGKSTAQINAELAEFDVWDRYDADGDQDFDEPDGYIDHFQIVHAGEGEETGGGAQGTNAIWSHRWYTAYQGIGVWGPPTAPFGGMEFGGAGTFGELGGPNATGIWVGDYTMQPENGGLGVFAHEYAHDLGLPDQYDTSGGENSSGFWTIMSSGSYLSASTAQDLGSRPGDFNFWEKFQLGWAKYDVAFAGAKSTHRLSPAERNTKQAQGLFVVLPDKEVSTDLGDPYAGTAFYYSGAGDNVDNSMSRSVALPAGAVGLTAQVRYDIELDWDYAYLTVDGNPVATNRSSSTNPNTQNFGNGITGSSGGNWIALTADLSVFAGGTHLIGFRYWTDGAVVESGFQVDEIAVNGTALGDNETGSGWTFDGFSVTDGLESSFNFNAYVAEYRTYRDYDSGLQTGPYNFGFLNTLPDWVEHFAYQDGLLVSYWDNSFTDNNTSGHNGGGLILPIDAHPNALVRPNATPWRSRVQAYDSTFGLWPTDGMTLHVNSVESVIPSLPAVSVFNDSTDFWDPSSPLANVITPNTGTTIRVVGLSATGFLQVNVNQ
jgi:immune inhibitor A